MAAFGIKAIQPQDNEHIFGFATARGTADDSLLEVWNGPTNADLVYTLDKEGQHQSASGSAARPTYSFEADKDTGRYLSGAASMLDVVSGTAVGTWTAGKLTLVQLQVDNLNLNGNTLSSTAGTDLLITPLSGQQIVLDGAIVIDAGVVTGATSITSTNFVGTLTGASTATLVTVVDSTDTTSSIAMFDSATGTLAAKTDAGLTYNAGTGVLTATGFTGPLTGLASTSTLASTVVVVDSTDTSSFIAMFDSATGSLAAKTDAGLTYNAGTGMLTATGLTGPLTGLASTASVATLANTVVVVDSSDTTSFPAFFDSATGSLAIKTDASNLTYNAGTGILTAAGFAGPLVGDVTGDLAGDVTGNSDTATLASTVTVAASGGDTTSHIAMFDSASGSLAAKTDPGITYNATSNVLTAAGFAGPITGAVTGNADTATLASTVTVAASGGDTSSHIAMFNSATGSLAVLTDPGITYNAGTNVLTSTFAGNITGNVTGDVTGDLQGDVTGNSDTATVSSTVVVVDSTDASSFIAMFDSATGSLAAKTDAGLTYNASTGMLTATGLTGPLTGVAATATALATARTIGGTSFDGTANIAVALSATATALATARAINGVNFDGTAPITVTAAAGTLTGTTLKSTVVTSSLTAVGTIATGVWNGTKVASAYLDDDTAHLSGTQTFSGAKTFSAALVASSTLAVTGDTSIANGSGLVVGHTAQISVGGVTPEMQVLGSTTGDQALVVGAFVASTSGPVIEGVKSRAAIGSFATVETGDDVLDISGYADDGTDYTQRTALIRYGVEGTVAANRVPGNMKFYTAADAAGSAIALALTIDSSQDITMAGDLFATSASGPFTRYTRTNTNNRFDIGTDGTNMTFAQQDGGGFSFNGDMVVSAAGAHRTITVGDGSSGSYSGLILRAANTQKAWKIVASQTISSGLEFIPGTSAGNTTFTTPTMSMVAAGVSVTGTLATTGASTFVGNKGRFEAHGLLSVTPSAVGSGIGATGDIVLGRSDTSAYLSLGADGLANISRSGGSGATVLALNCTTTSVAGNLTVSGTGPHAIGGAVLGYAQLVTRGAFVSDGSSTAAYGTLIANTLTGASGDTSSLSLFGTSGNIVTQTASESIGVVCSAKIDEPVITDNLTGDITVAASLYITNAPTEGETNAALYVASGASMFADGSAAAPGVAFSGDTDTGIWRPGSNQMRFATTGVDRLTLNASGMVGIGDTLNANMTMGLTINQGAADNEILALKSSDVVHNMTNKAEADTYGRFFKYQATSGGLTVGGLKDADGSAGLALVLEGFLGEAADTTKSTSAVGIVQVETAVTAGDGNVQAAGSDSNLFTVANNGTARFIFDAEGSGHADIEWTTF